MMSMWGKHSSYRCGRWPPNWKKPPPWQRRYILIVRNSSFFKGARRAATPPTYQDFRAFFVFWIFICIVDDVWWITLSKSSAICVNFYSVFPPDRTSLLMGGNEQKNLALLEPANEVFVHRPSTPLSIHVCAVWICMYYTFISLWM